MKKSDRKKTFAETVARIIFLICAVVSILAVVSITFYMIKNGLPAFQKVGIKEILFETQWMPTAKEPLFGIAFVKLWRKYVSSLFARTPIAKAIAKLPFAEKITSLITKDNAL